MFQLIISKKNVFVGFVMRIKRSECYIVASSDDAVLCTITQSLGSPGTIAATLISGMVKQLGGGLSPHFIGSTTSCGKTKLALLYLLLIFNPLDFSSPPVLRLLYRS